MVSPQDKEDKNDSLYSLDYPNSPKRSDNKGDTIMTDRPRPSHTPWPFPYNELETYSTWEYRNGNIVPIRHDGPPSPCPPCRDLDQMLHNRETGNEKLLIRAQQKLSKAQASRASDTLDAQMYSDLVAGMDYRYNQFQTAEEQRQKGEPYAYLPPMDLGLRRHCARYPDLLNRYYEVEFMVGEPLQRRLDLLKQRMAEGGDVDDDDWIEFCTLLDIEEARARDAQQNGDREVLIQVLDDVERRLDTDIDRLAAGVDMAYPGLLVTRLPRWVDVAVRGHRRLAARLDNMKRQESALFPSRQIAGRIPMYQTQSYDDYSNGGGDGNVRVDVDMDMDVNMDDRETNADEGGPSSSPCARKRASADALEGTANKKMRPDPKRRGYEHEIVVIDDDDNDEDQVPILGEVVGRFVVIEDDDDDDDDDNEEKKKEKKKKKKEDDIEKQLPHR